MKTNSNNINNSKRNKTKSVIALTSLILVLSIVNITLLTGTIFGINLNTTTNANALSYSTSEDISFTFAPTLSIGLSTNSLTIDNLVPGTTSDSNTVTVTVSSNTPYGYVLSAGVGSNDTTSPYYNTSSLTHENTTISNVFSSVDTNASLDSLDTDNTWGYSTSTNDGTSWSTYSGLSNTTTKPLLDISDPATPSTIDFKIAARSASTQASGTYNNVITFYAVGKPEPVPTYMQDAATIKAELQNVGDEMQAIDSRDGKEYWVTKLSDGNIWMTQNLDLDLSTEKTLTPADTDIVVDWTPIRDTIVTTDFWPSWGASVYDPGDLYWDGTVLNGGGSIEDYTTAFGDSHYQIGNYYNWPAAIATNDGYSYTVSADVNQSICPAGWRLPNSGLFQALVNSQNLTVGIDGNIHIAPVYFVYGGVWMRGYQTFSGSGSYWSSIVSNNIYAQEIKFLSATKKISYRTLPKDYGLSIRCVMR